VAFVSTLFWNVNCKLSLAPHSHRPLGRRAQQRTGGKRATTGRRVIDHVPVELDLLQVAISSLRQVMDRPAMKEGFDVALEMSGNPKAFADILPNMFHGGKIALLGIMPGSAAIDWNTVVFSALTIKGIYGREMYETWYKMTVMIQSGLDISPVITHRFPYTQFKEAIELMKSGNSGKIMLDWSELSS
jgi:threonine dehydrogenase-like Zn-dependent dehydrogenase